MFHFRSRRLFVLFAVSMGCAAVLSEPWSARPAKSSVSAAERTKTGIDVLEGQKFAPLRGKRVALITNQTGVDAQWRRTIDALAHASGVKLVALFSLDQGILGRAD